jgi:hypothetical protein
VSGRLILSRFKNRFDPHAKHDGAEYLQTLVPPANDKTVMQRLLNVHSGSV